MVHSSDKKFRNHNFQGIVSSEPVMVPTSASTLSC